MSETAVDPVVPETHVISIEDPLVEIRDLSLSYGDTQALFDVSLQIPQHQVTAFIGPSGCGKSTLLRCINRLNDPIDSVRITGTITLDGRDTYAPDYDVIALRRQVGMVFQKSNPFPKSIFENVAYGLRIAGENDRTVLDEAVERGWIVVDMKADWAQIYPNEED